MAGGELAYTGMTAEGEVSSYEDNVASLVQEISDHIQEPSFGATKILHVLNRGLRKIVSLLSTQNVWLPSLATTGEVNARSDALSCRLPADWHGNLCSCLDLTNGQQLAVVDWPTMQEMVASALPGRLHSVSVNANLLNYWHAPDNNHRLRLSYYRLPANVTPTTRITSLPPELSSGLLVSYGLYRCYSEIETEENDGKVNTKAFQAEFTDELANVVRSVGAYPTVPVEPNDTMGASLW